MGHGADLPDSRPRRRWWIAAVGGLVFAGAAAVLFHWAVRTPTGQLVDVTYFGRAQAFNDVLELPAEVVRRGLPIVLIVVCLGLGVNLVHRNLRRNWRVPVIGVAFVGATAILVPWLRETVLTRPQLGDHGYTQNTYPSGHVAVTTALVVAALALWPRPVRWPVIAVGALAIGGGAVASVVGHAHRPSDVVGAVLVVGALACAAVPPMGRGRITFRAAEHA